MNLTALRRVHDIEVARILRGSGYSKKAVKRELRREHDALGIRALDQAIEQGDVIGDGDDQDALARENDDMSAKKQRKLMIQQLRQAGLGPLMKASAATGVSPRRLATIAGLENLLKAAQADLPSRRAGYVRTEDFQATAGIKARLYREAVAAEREAATKAVAATFGRIRVGDPQGSVRAQEAALAAATGRDIRRVHSASGGGPRSRAIDMFGRSQRGVLRSVIDGTATPEELEGETILESQRKIQALEGQLRKAANPSDRERIGYMLTRAKLIDGHRRGLI
jgi:hypothetical protein